jgi:hypothetical protein
LGSTRKVIKLVETITNMSYTPPSPIKATPTSIASDSDDVSTASVSKVGDVMMTSSSQKVNYLRKIVLHLAKTHLRANHRHSGCDEG